MAVATPVVELFNCFGFPSFRGSLSYKQEQSPGRLSGKLYEVNTRYYIEEQKTVWE
jgi:hypothetical protein